MLAELTYIKSPWATLRWAVGGSDVLIGRWATSSLTCTKLQMEGLMNNSRLSFNLGLASLPVALLFLAQTVWSFYHYPHYEIAMRFGKVVEIYQLPRVSVLTIVAASLAVVLSASLLYAGKRLQTGIK